MTATLSSNGHRPDLTGLSDVEARDRAEAMARSEPELSGPQLARRFGRPDRWGRRRIAAVRPVTPDSAPAPGADAVVGAAVSAPASSRTPSPRRPASARPRPGQPERAPWPLRAVIVAGAIVVCVVTALVSYTHIRDLAAAHGMGYLSSWLPLGVDGLVLVCSGSLIADRRCRRAGSKAAWAGVALGLVGSVAANVLAAPPDLVSRVFAAYPPLALALATHQVIHVLGEPEGR